MFALIQWMSDKSTSIVSEHDILGNKKIDIEQL